MNVTHKFFWYSSNDYLRLMVETHTQNPDILNLNTFAYFSLTIDVFLKVDIYLNSSKFYRSRVGPDL